MADDYTTPDIYSLSDDEGNEYTFEVLDRIEQNGNEYVAMTPVYDDPKEQLNDNGELVIMKSCTEEGEDFFAEIDDEEEFDSISAVFTSRLSDLFEIED